MRLILIAIAALVLQDTKELTKNWKHRWADAAAGSSVTFEVTVMVPDMSGSKEMKTTRIETVTKVDGKNVTIEFNDDGAKNSQVFHIGLPSEYEGPCTKGADEEIKVGDKSYKCSVTEIKKESGTVVQLLKIWTCADAPSWAVKQAWSQSTSGKVKAGWAEELTGTEKLKIAGKEVACAIVRRTTEAATVKAVDTEWRTPDLPGGVAKATAQTFINGKEMTEAATTKVATGFERK